MNDIEILLSDTCDFFELQLHHRPMVEQDLILMVGPSGQEPQVIREFAPKLGLLVKVIKVE